MKKFKNCYQTFKSQPTQQNSEIAYLSASQEQHFNCTNFLLNLSLVNRLYHFFINIANKRILLQHKINTYH